MKNQKILKVGLILSLICFILGLCFSVGVMMVCLVLMIKARQGNDNSLGLAVIIYFILLLASGIILIMSTLGTVFSSMSLKGFAFPAQDFTKKKKHIIKYVVFNFLTAIFELLIIISLIKSVLAVILASVYALTLITASILIIIGLKKAENLPNLKENEQENIHP